MKVTKRNEKSKIDKISLRLKIVFENIYSRLYLIAHVKEVLYIDIPINKDSPNLCMQMSKRDNLPK